jgi:D-glycero-D-manno-heptose 1,7-bisphosphate phosphatase
VRDWSEFVWLPGALDALRMLHENAYRVIVVSNQAGVARGAMSETALTELHARMKQTVEAAGGAISEIYSCRHDWDEGCPCRKPAPGMLFAAQRDFHLDLSRCHFFGDDERDAIAAERAGCRFIQVSPSRPLIDCVTQLLDLDRSSEITKQNATGKEVFYG